eukprot:5752890-Heterocapsa_arctica.AAC.1
MGTWRAPFQGPYERPPGDLTPLNRSRTASPVVVVPPRHPSPLLRMTPKSVAPSIAHQRPPPPKPPNQMAFVRPLRAPPRPWCAYHPTS